MYSDFWNNTFFCVLNIFVCLFSSCQNVGLEMKEREFISEYGVLEMFEFSYCYECVWQLWLLMSLLKLLKVHQKDMVEVDKNNHGSIVPSVITTGYPVASILVCCYFINWFFYMVTNILTWCKLVPYTSSYSYWYHRSVFLNILVLISLYRSIFW